MPQLREIPLKPKPRPSTTATTRLPPTITSLQSSSALPTPPATPSMPPPPRPPHPKPPSQELIFQNLIRGPAVTLRIPGDDEYVLPMALLCQHSGFLREEIKGMMVEMGMGSKKRRLEGEEGDGQSALLEVEKNKKKKKKCKLESDETEGRQEEEEDRPVPEVQDEIKVESMTHSSLILSLPIQTETFALFLSYIYKSEYTPVVDALPPSYTNTNTSTSATTATVSTTPSAADFIPPSIHAYLFAQYLRSSSFMNHTLTHIYAGIGVYYPLSPTLMNFVWVQTKCLTLGSGSKTVVPLRRLLLDVLIAYWPNQQSKIIARNDPGAWTMLFEAHQDLRQEFILGLQGGNKVQAVEGYFVGLGRW